jgi:hypothetical protein
MVPSAHRRGTPSRDPRPARGRAIRRGDRRARRRRGAYRLEPFEISASQAGELARKAQRHRACNEHAISEDGRAREIADATAAIREEQEPVAQSEDAELEYLEEQIARIRAIEEPTPQQLSTLREAMRARNEIERQAAQRRAPLPAPKDGEPSDLAKRLLARREAHDRATAAGERCPLHCSYCSRPSLVDRRHQLDKRWVTASLGVVRAQHPGLDGLAVCNHPTGRSLLSRRERRLDQEWLALGGHNPWWHQHADDLALDAYDRLSELLDCDEAELEQLEASIPA